MTHYTSTGVSHVISCQSSLNDFSYPSYGQGNNLYTYPSPNYQVSALNDWAQPINTSAASTVGQVLSSCHQNSTLTDFSPYQTYSSQYNSAQQYNGSQQSNLYYSSNYPQSTINEWQQLSASTLTLTSSTTSTDSFHRNSLNSRKSSSSSLSQPKKSGRGRKQEPNNQQPEAPLKYVYIWNLDDLILFDAQEKYLHHKVTSLTSFATPKKYTQQELHELDNFSKFTRTMANEIAMKYFFYNDLSKCDQVHINDVTLDVQNIPDLNEYQFKEDRFNDQDSTLSVQRSGARNQTEWQRRLAYRYLKIKEDYSKCNGDLKALLNTGLIDNKTEIPRLDMWNQSLKIYDQITHSWIPMVIDILSKISGRVREKPVNVLITNSSLVRALAKAILFDIAKFFPIENIYSSLPISNKDNCVQKIKERFGSKAVYISIGDSGEDRKAALSNNIPFWPLNNSQSLRNLQQVVTIDFL